MFTSQTAETIVASDDTCAYIFDASASAFRKMTRANFTAALAESAISGVVEDTTPQLGGNLDTNSQNILIDDAHFIADENGNEQIIFKTTDLVILILPTLHLARTYSVIYR